MWTVRTGSGPDQALEALWRGLISMDGGWVIDLDIQSFFDEVDRGHLRDFLGRWVRDGVIRRTIGKWLKAGVMEDGAVHYPAWGTPQGGVISPLLSNLYLPRVLDLWFERDVKPRLRGRAVAVRFADDAVLAFEREEDARRVLAVLGKRFGKYGLRLHPEKTRLVDFRSPSRRTQRERSFALLGFTHHWGRSRKGRWVVQRKTAKDRLMPCAPSAHGAAGTATYRWRRSGRRCGGSCRATTPTTPSPATTGRLPGSAGGLSRCGANGWSAGRRVRG